MKKGFTLIEIMVVIAILGVLITMVTGSFMASQKKGRDLKRKSDLAQIGKALEIYFNDRGAYPLSDANGQIVGCGDPSTQLTACAAGDVWSNSGTTPATVYMSQLPADPTGQRYIYQSDGTYYRLYARLENSEDSQIRTYSAVCSGTEGVCNFGLSSPNTQP